MSEEETAAVICPELTNTDDREAPPKFTVEPLTKFVPKIARLNPGEPAIALEGEIDEIVGGGRKTLNIADVEFPPPGFGVFTKILTGPAVTIAVPGTEAVNCVVLTNVVGSVCAPNEIMEPETKLVPFTVKVNDPLP